MLENPLKFLNQMCANVHIYFTVFQYFTEIYKPLEKVRKSEVF